jgi:serine/threonine-protein kinase
MAAQSFGKYRVTELMGRGGMAEVYQAYHPDLQRHVAIKVIYPHLAADEGFGARFRREAQLVASLRHPHIVQLYDFDLRDDLPFMVMEYLPGGTLKERLTERRARGERYSPGEVAWFLTPIADALDYAHQKEAVHRDIKPANLLFTARGEPVLTDFGIAKILSETLAFSATGGILGTPAYMSPEQATGDTIDARSDLYSLGVVLYEMLAGQVPFRGDSPTAVMMKHLSEPPPPPRAHNANIPEAVEAVVLRALAKKPGERFPTAGALAQAFQAALRGERPVQPAYAEADAPTMPELALADAATMLEAPGDALAHTLPDAPPSIAAPPPVVAVPSPKPPKTAEPPRRAALQAMLRENQQLLVAVVLALLGLAAGTAYGASRLAGLSLPLGNYLPFLAAFLLASSALASALMWWRAPARPQRMQATVMLALVGLVGVAGGRWLATSPSVGGDGLVVAVGQFDGREATRRVDFGRRIFEELQAELRNVEAAVSVVRTNEVYADAAQARAAGAAQAATLVIWGWYDDEGVSPHLEVLDAPSFGPEIPFLIRRAEAAAPGEAASVPTLGEVTSLVRVPAMISDVDLFVEDGPQQMAAVSAAILGLSFYLDGELDRALSLFDRALQPGQEGEAIEGQAAIHFYRAAALYQQNDIPSAIADLEQAVELDPALSAAHHNLAIAYAATCEPEPQLDRALEEAEQAARLAPDEAASHLLLGSLYLQAARLDEALEVTEEAQQREADNPTVYSLLAEVQAALGNEAEALAAWQQGLTLSESGAASEPDSADAHLTLGDALVAAGEYERALEAYQTAQRLDPSNPAALWGLGNAHYWKGDLAESEQAYLEWAEMEPESGAPLLLLGLLYREQERVDEAIPMLRRAGELSPCDPDPPLLLGGIFWQEEQYAEAVTAYERAVALDPENADAFYLLGSTYYFTDNLLGAVEALEKAVALDPTLAQAFNLLGQAHYDQQQYEEAVSAWEQAIEAAPEEPSYYVSLAGGLEKLGQWGDAEAAYEQALALQDDSYTRVYLAVALQQQGRSDEAIAEYERALALDSENALAYSGLGEVYTQQGRLDEAEAAYKEALEREESASLHAQLGTVYQFQGERDAAIAEYRQAVELDPDDPLNHLQLATLYTDARELDAAAEAYRAAQELAPDNPGAYSGLAFVEYKRCRLPSMEQAAEAALDLAPESTLYQAIRASVHEAQGQDEEARQAYTELRAAPEEDAVAHLFAGEYLLRTGNLQQAISELERAIAAGVLTPLFLSIAHSDLGQVLYEQEQFVAAQAQWHTALEAFPANAAAQVALGDLALRDGALEEALAAYEQAEALLPNYALQFSADQAALLEIGLPLRRGIALEGGDGAQVALDEALEQAQALVESLPQWPQARFALALVHTARGDKDAAEEEFTAAIQCDQSLRAARTRAEALLADLR